MVETDRLPRGISVRNARVLSHAGRLSHGRTTMMSEEISGKEPSESVNEQSDTETGGEGVETVHTANEWRLSVREDGSVEASTPVPYDGAKRWTTKSKWWAPTGKSYRYGLSVEDVLARYAHETRNDRSAEEHGAALRDGIIDALCAIATDATCGRGECDGEATHVRHINAPTGPSTALVCDKCATEGTYVTLYVLDTDTDARPEVEA